MRVCEKSSCSNETNNPRFCCRACSNAVVHRRTRACADGTSLCSMPNCNCEGRKIQLCIICNEPRGKSSVKYCGSKCATVAQFDSKGKLDAWLAGTLNASVPAGDKRVNLSNWARQYLLNEASWKCTQCGWNTPHPKTSTPPLEVDHIDGDRRNNFKSNLRVLCPNCHALTNTYRRYNYQHVQTLKETTWRTDVHI